MVVHNLSVRGLWHSRHGKQKALLTPRPVNQLRLSYSVLENVHVYRLPRSVDCCWIFNSGRSGPSSLILFFDRPGFNWNSASDPHDWKTFGLSLDSRLSGVRTRKSINNYICKNLTQRSLITKWILGGTCRQPHMLYAATAPNHQLPPITDLALGWGGGHLAHILLVFGIRGVLRQLVEDVGARRVSDIQVVSEGRAVGGRAGERMLLVGLLWNRKQQGHYSENTLMVNS